MNWHMWKFIRPFGCESCDGGGGGGGQACFEVCDGARAVVDAVAYQDDELGSYYPWPPPPL